MKKMCWLLAVCGILLTGCRRNETEKSAEHAESIPVEAVLNELEKSVEAMQEPAEKPTKTGKTVQAVPEWEVRYAQISNQTPEWTAAGHIPAYEISYSDNGNEVFIDSAGNPDYRGTVMIGHKFTVPQNLEQLPAALYFNIDFQTWNEAKDRSCGIYFYLMTAERYAKFSADPAAAKLDNLPRFTQRVWTERDWGVLAQETVYGGTEDVEQWQSWRSPDTAPYLRKKLGQELVAVFTFQAAHQGALQWGKFRNFRIEKLDEAAMWKEFLGTKIDLERPDMQGVKSALAADDLDGACAAFVEHMKNREAPRLPESDLPMTADENMIKKADELARRYFDYGHGEPVQWGELPQWEANPPNYEQWTVGNNRHKYWLTMGRAYAQTGDEKYPKEYAAQAVDFMQRYPYFIGDKGDDFRGEGGWMVDGPIVSFGRMNTTLNSGDRMSKSWWPAYYYFRKSPSLTVKDHMWIWKGFYDHVNHMMDPRVFHPDGNWGSWEAAGVYKCGVMMPEFKESESWIKTGEERLKLLLTTLVYPDGTPKEISCGYHLANADFFRSAVNLAAVNGLSLDPALKQTIEKMYEIVMFSSRPGFGSVGFGDSNWSGGAVVDAANQVKDLFPMREDFNYFATRGKEGTPPDFTSWMSPWAGWYCMRTGWTPEDNYLVLDAGPIGTSHFHADKLGIVVHAGKQMVLHETSNYAYDGSLMQQYVRGTWSHNTVIVDEKIQRSHGMNAYLETKTPLDNRWFTDENFDFAEGVYNLGYVAVNQPMSNVAHHREILFVKPDFWIVVDHMVPQDDQEHDYRALFHMSPGEIKIDEEKKRAMTEWDGGAFRIIPFRPDDMNLFVVEGQTEPYYLGWMPAGSQKKKASPVAVYNWKATGPTTMAWALVPKTEKGWSVGSVELLNADGAGTLQAKIYCPDGEVRFQRLPGETAPAKGDYRCAIYGKDGKPAAEFQSP